jgi:hypothetical protein
MAKKTEVRVRRVEGFSRTRSKKRDETRRRNKVMTEFDIHRKSKIFSTRPRLVTPTISQATPSRVY